MIAKRLSFLLSFILISAAVCAQQTPIPWARYRGTAKGTAVGLGSGATNIVKWTVPFTSAIYNPAIGPDGTVYVSCLQGLFAIDGVTGAIKWSDANIGRTQTTPAISSNGMLYTGNEAGYVYAVNAANGEIVWSTPPPQNAQIVGGRSPAIGLNGDVYVPSNDGNLYAYDPETGTVKWFFFALADNSDGLGFPPTTPTVGSDGTIFVCGHYTVYALTPAGKYKWSMKLSHDGWYGQDSPTIGPDGTLYQESALGAFYALKPADGTIIWQSQGTYGFVAPPALTPEGVVIALSEDAYVYAWDSTGGAPVWTYNTLSGGQIGPAVAADGTIYVASGQNTLVALDGATGGLKWTYAGSAGFTDPAIGADGTLYVGCGNSLVCFASGILPTALTLSPSTVVGSENSIGTVTLNLPAPPAGLVVALSSSNPTASTPASVTVPSGQKSANFTIGTAIVSSQQTATVKANSNGVVQTATLTISPPAVAGISVTPEFITSGTTATGKVSLNGPAPTGGVKVALATNSGAVTVPSSLSISAGQSSVSFSVTGANLKTIAYATITASTSFGPGSSVKVAVGPPSLVSLSLNPAVVTGGTSSDGTVALSGVAPSGGLKILLSASNKAATVPGSIMIPAGSATGTFTIYTSFASKETSVNISANFGAGFQTQTLSINPGTISSVSLSPTAVVGGSPSTGTVNLTGAAPKGGVVVKLSSTQSAATVPSSVTVSAGKTSATFQVKTVAVGAATSAAILGTLNGVSNSALLMIEPPALASLTLSPASVKGGSSSTGTVKLTGPAPTGGVIVTLSSSGSATVPASVTVPAGKSSATFIIKTTKVSAKTTATIKAADGQSPVTATLTIS